MILIHYSTHGFPIYGSYFGDHPDNYVIQEYDCNADHTWCNETLFVSAVCNSAGVECNGKATFFFRVF